MEYSGRMLVLGHLGIGARIARPWSREASLAAILVGALLPDLIDKPLYLFGHLDPSWAGGSRLFAHSLLFLGLLVLSAAQLRSRALWGLAAGVASHYVLDLVSKAFGSPHDFLAALQILAWPAYGPGFPSSGRAFPGWAIAASEAIGAALLIAELWGNKKREPFPAPFSLIQRWR